MNRERSDEMSQNNNNMSIEDILREAQEVLSSIGSEREESAEEDVKTYVPQKKKTAQETRESASADAQEQEEEVKEFTGRSAENEKQAAPAQDKTRTIPAIGSEPASDKTIRVPRQNTGRQTFFKKNSADEEYGSTPPQIIEKAATIKSKSRFDTTSDLQEIPTILAVEELDKTRRVLSATGRP